MRPAIEERLRLFTETLLVRRGGLVDWPPEAERGLALLPPALAERLDCAAEETTLAFDRQNGGLAVGLASHFLDQAAPLLEAEPLAGRFKGPALYLKQSDMAEPVARAFTWLNAKVVVRHAQPSEVEYQTWTFLVSVHSDDQWDELVSVSINAASGARMELPDPLGLAGLRPQAGSAGISERLYRQAARAAVEEAGRRAGPFIGRMEARLERDRRRLGEYYGALLDGDGHRPGRVRHEPTLEEIEARRRAVDLELRRKLAEVRERYALSVKLTPVALASVALHALAVDCEVYRKKAVARRQIYWNPLTKQLEPLCCGRCGAPIFAVAFSDDALEPLCAACLD